MSVQQKQSNFVKELYFIRFLNVSAAFLSTFLQNAKPLCLEMSAELELLITHCFLKTVKHFKLSPLKEKVKHTYSINNFCNEHAFLPVTLLLSLASNEQALQLKSETSLFLELCGMDKYF